MKTTGWIFLIFGILSFLGACSKGDSVFGPLFWVALGIFLLYRANRKKADKESSIQKNNERISTTENVINIATGDKSNTLSISQREAAICLVAFFAGFKAEIAYSSKASSILSRTCQYFGIEYTRPVIEKILAKYKDADKMLDTVVSIKDVKAKEFLISTCYELAKYADTEEAYFDFYNIAEDMGYSKQDVKSILVANSL